MDMAAEVSSMVIALEQATLMAKQLPLTTDPSQIHQIYSSLQSTNRHLSSFLASSFHHPQPPLPPPPPFLVSAENSVSSDVGDPMQVGEEDTENEQNQHPKATVDGVEERMRECFIQNKRPKRTLSPSAAAAAEQRRQLIDQESTKFSSSSSDHHGTKLRSLELIYQFHG